MQTDIEMHTQRRPGTHDGENESDGCDENRNSQWKNAKENGLKGRKAHSDRNNNNKMREEEGERARASGKCKSCQNKFDMRASRDTILVLTAIGGHNESHWPMSRRTAGYFRRQKKVAHTRARTHHKNTGEHRMEDGWTVVISISSSADKTQSSIAKVLVIAKLLFFDRCDSRTAAYGHTTSMAARADGRFLI